MGSFTFSSLRKVLLLYLVLICFASILVCAWSMEPHHGRIQSSRFLGRRKMLGSMESSGTDEEVIKPKKKKISDTLSSKDQTKPIKTSPSSKNQTKLAKTPSPVSTKNNQTKISTSKTSSGSGTASNIDSSTKSKTLSSSSKNNIIELKKLNSTSSKAKKLNSTTAKINSTKPTSGSTKKSSDLIAKPMSSPKNKTTKPTTTKITQNLNRAENSNSQLGELYESEKKNKVQNNKKPKKQSIPKKQTGVQVQPSWIDEEEDGDLVSEFADLPMRFQKTLIPDLARISTTSKAYLNKANKDFTEGFKPIVGNKYAPTIASLVSFSFILIPLLLVSLIFNRIKAYFSLQKLLIFVQVYLSIYFAILSLSAIVTGLEPLKFFYATSQSTYVCLQVLQTLGYVLYLLLLLMYLILVFSTDCGMGSKLLGLAQTFVGFAVGLHYYVAVFHRVVLRQPPKTNWKIHGIYATCFFLICLCARAERRKKAYLVDGGEESKTS